MRTMHPALLVGAYDWDRERLPAREFEERLDAVRGVMAARGWRALVVHGDSPDYAALGYLTNFVPKLGPALALVAESGAPRLLLSGAPNMMASAQRLTWLDDLHPLRNAAKEIADWLAGLADAGARFPVGVWGAEGMRSRLFGTVTEACAPRGPVEDAGEALSPLVRRKRPAELALIRESCRILGAAIDAMGAAHSSGAGAVAATLEGERAAQRSGAQDVRVLFSLDGGRTLRPFEDLDDARADPLVVYCAVRHLGYWSEGMASLGATSSPAHGKASAALAALVAAARPGATGRDLAAVIARHVPPRQRHPVTAASAGNGIGLSPDERPALRTDGDDALEAGGVYTLRAGVSDAGDGHALLSAMVALGDGGGEVLWSAAP